eukprot:2673074-Pleurochrysis_carterae.AAC.4
MSGSTCTNYTCCLELARYYYAACATLWTTSSNWRTDYCSSACPLHGIAATNALFLACVVLQVCEVKDLD